MKTASTKTEIIIGIVLFVISAGQLIQCTNSSNGQATPFVKEDDDKKNDDKEKQHNGACSYLTEKQNVQVVMFRRFLPNPDGIHINHRISVLMIFKPTGHLIKPMLHKD
jgi:hypothetical protein